MSDRAFRLALFALLAAAILGSTLDVMEVDAAQYAAMSQDLMASDNWLKLYHRGQDYLDKPPLLFWLSALSFKVFGVHNWSYKLPSILFACLGLFSTYRFALLHHGKEVARHAVLILGGSAAFLLMTNDVRCDTILMGSVITAVWMGSAWMMDRRWWQLIGTAVAIALGMLAKGPIGLVAPLLALGSEVVGKRRWDVLRDPRLLVVPLLVIVALFPMCVGLNEQHGMHGLRFYFWEHSFGRITGENRWKDDSTIFFFTHEIIWLLLPWTPVVLAGLWRSGLELVKRRSLPEYASIGGATLVFIALSLSHFKLPHYLYVTLPLFTVLGAREWVNEWSRGLRIAMGIVLGLLVALAIVLVGYSFPEGSLPYLLLLPGVITFVAFLTKALEERVRWVLVTAWTWAAIAVMVNGHIYPQLLDYQANAKAGQWFKQHDIDPERSMSVGIGGTALNFYAGHTVEYKFDAHEAMPFIAPGMVVYTDPANFQGLIERGAVPQEVVHLKNYRVQLLGIDFLDPATRDRSLTDHVIVRF